MSFKAVSTPSSANSDKRMVRVRRSTIIDAPVDAVWRLLRDFNGHDAWHPIVARSVLEEGRRTDQIGAVRNFTLTSGERVREILIALSDRDRRLRYAIVDSDLPLEGYVAEFFLKRVTDGERTFWSWRSGFSTPPGREATLARLVAEKVYEAGFEAVRALLGRSRAAPVAPGAAAATTATARLAGTAEGIEGEAMIVERHGGPEELRPVPIRAPAPGPGEARIRHAALGVNFIDIYCRSGHFDLLTPPGAPGMEAAGTVVDVGPGVRHLRPGQRVGYACPPVGAYCTVRTMDAALVFPLPDRIDDDIAAACLLKGMTAEYLLHRVHPLARGDIALVFAPAGGVGHLLCQWAAHLGARVIGATTSEAKARAARAWGVRDIVRPGAESLEDQVMALTRGHGADVIYDGVGRSSFGHSLAALAIRGHLVSFGEASGDIGAWDLGSLSAKSARISRPNFAHYTDTPDKVEAIAGRLFDAMDRRIVKVDIGRRFALRDAAAAHRALEARETVASTILIPEPAVAEG